MTENYRDFFETFAGADPRIGLHRAAFSLLKGNPKWGLAQLLRDDLANLPAEARNLWFGEEQRLEGLRTELAEVSGWTREDAAAAAARLSELYVEQLQDANHLVAPWLDLVEAQLALVVAWRPQSDDPAVLLQLELFRSRLLVWLADAKDWANRHYANLTVRAVGFMTGKEYQAYRLRELTAEIAAAEANVERMYADARAALPFLRALRDQFPAIAPLHV